MRPELIWVAALVVPIAGCFEGPVRETVMPGDPLDEGGWADVTYIFEIPRGDHFGVFAVDFSPADGFDHGGLTHFGLTVDRSLLGEKDFIQVSAHWVRDGVAKWGVTSLGSAGGSVSLGRSTERDKPPSGLFFVETHAEAPVIIRTALWRGPDQEMPVTTRPGEWTVRGPAEVSFYLGQMGISHNVQLANPAGPEGDLSVGVLDVSSEHSVDGLHLEHAVVVAIATAAAGKHTLDWVSDGRSLWSEQLVAHPLDVTGLVVAGPHERKSALTSTLEAIALFPAVFYSHVSSPFTFELLSLTEEPWVDGLGRELAWSGDGCLISLSAFCYEVA